MNNRFLILSACLFAAALLAACDDGGSTPKDVDGDSAAEVDAGDADVSPDELPDEPDPDVGPDELPDEPEPDANDADLSDGDSEVSEIDDVDPDVDPDHTHAVVGARCPLTELVGQVEIESSDPSVYFNAWLREGPDPTIGEPELTTAACKFYRENRSCTGCTEMQQCSAAGTCVERVASRLGVQAALVSATERQDVVQDEWGGLWAEVGIAGPWAVELVIDGHVVSTDALLPPEALVSPAVSLAGDSMAPEGLEATWQGGAADTEVFTHIHINHHVRGPTFTECSVDAPVGAMSVPGNMLMPLAAVTGLEFQGLEHQRVAAAHTPFGCIEFRWLRREWVTP